MNDEIAVYTFLPWLKQGIANKINAPVGDAIRATVNVDLNITGQLVGGGTEERIVSQPIEVYGPGDIVGIDPKNIVKVEPADWITNFEPNYLPYIEFYDEDFPWRYSPDLPQNDRVLPWLALVVLTEEEFKDIKNIANQPLASIEVTSFEGTFPPAAQIWAWAHVHVNKALGNAEQVNQTNINQVLNALETTLANDPDVGYSRIMCPRKLDPKTGYHAFLVPTFETGRLAGLGIDPHLAPNASQSSWESYEGKEASSQMPYYHRWYFSTGTQGDFEYLVRLLKPQPVDSRVGRRDMDVQRPGSNVSGINDPELGGVLRLGGALKIPEKELQGEEKEEAEAYENWDQPYPHPFQEELAELLNLADQYQENTAIEAHTNLTASSSLHEALSEDEDPVITPPLYGKWHALVQRILTERDGAAASPNDNWIHELNLDPRWRVAAGFGTKVVQKNQEKYMKKAWEQVGDVLEANQRIRLAQLAHFSVRRIYNTQLAPLEARRTEKFILMTAPVNNRVISQGLTVRHQFKTSTVTFSPTSMVMRKLASPRGRIVKKLNFTDQIRQDNLLDRINREEVTAAPPKKVAAEVPTLNEAADQAIPPSIPDFLIPLLRSSPWLKFIPLALILLAFILVLIFFSLIALGIGIAAAVGLVYIYRQLDQWQDQIEQADSLKEDNLTPSSVDRLPNRPDFRIVAVGEEVNFPTGSSDSEEAARFKLALKDVYTVVAASRTVGQEPELPSLNFPEITTDTFQAINPSITVPRFMFQSVFIPPRISIFIGEVFKEAMAYPEFDIPMYKPLLKLSKDYFLPNIKHVEPNSISLLETNQRFIESYMVGLNHEFARELLWREYPTDQRGSYFRQFWDVSTFLTDGQDDGEAEKEKLKDIPPLHVWSRFSALGSHDHRQIEAGDKAEVVLLIRGEILKKYPTAVIYAQKAQWQADDDDPSKPDKTKERRLKDPENPDNPSKDEIKTPLYEAKVAPDIYFFGFDLTAEEAEGLTEGEPSNFDDRAGWFFVIKERPGEPRFGLDIGKTEAPEKIEVWNDLAWEDVAEGKAFIEIDNSTPTIDVSENPPEEDEGEGSGGSNFQEKIQQHTEDVNIILSKDMNAADLAYILYQVPVMVAVHAAEMLP